MQAILVSILRSRGAGYLSAVLGIAAVIAICVPLRDQLNNTIVALALLLVVLFMATGWGRGPGMVASVLGMLGFNFFFLPPVYTPSPSPIHKIGSRSPPLSSRRRLPGTFQSPQNDALQRQRPGGRQRGWRAPTTGA